MHHVKLAMLAGTALSMGLGFAQAADMPLKAPRAPVAAVDPWVGFYVGGNVGYSWGKTDTTTTTAPFFAQLGPNEFSFNFPGGASSTGLKPKGAVLGGQIGFTGRLAPHWLAGVEADLQWTGQKNSGQGGFFGFTRDCSSSDCSFLNTTDITARLNYFGTARGLVGIEYNGIWLYATAGLAYGEVSVSGSTTLTLIDNVRGSALGLFPSAFSYSKTLGGVAAGLGIQGILGLSPFTWKAEYLHLDLGAVGSGSFGIVPIVLVNTGRFTDDILRLSLNYHFIPGLP